MGATLVVASNRGPVSWRRADPTGPWEPRKGAGGLIVALGGALQTTPGTWVSVALDEGDRQVAAEHGGGAFDADTGEGRFRLRLVDVGDDYDAYYGEIASKLLWFTLHQLWAEPYEPTGIGWPEPWQRYVAVNRRLAEAVAEEAADADGDVEVHLQDYHLLVAAPIVRERVPHAKVVLYVHTPWVPPEYLRRLPDAVVDALREGLLACDLVGISSPRWAAHLRDVLAEHPGVTRDGDDLVGPGGRRTRVRDFVLGVDVEGLRRVAAAPTTRQLRDRLRDEAADRQLIVRADRTDLSKNILRGLQAYRLLLDEHPALRERVRFVALLNPSRQSVAEYRAYVEACQAEAAAITDRFGPEVLDLDLDNDFAKVVAALQSYDVLLTNPVLDGTNLVAKEGPALNERDGVLVLSRDAGAATAMRDALLVNPYDVHATAEALHTALTMPPDERARRAAALAAQAAQGAPGEWFAAVRAALADA